MPPAGSGWPGMTSSSPVKKQATRGRRRTSSVAAPMEAARPTAAGVRRVPSASTVLPAAMSSARRRTQAPDAGRTRKLTPVPSAPGSGRPASTSSCITTASAPGGRAAPVKMRATVPGWSGWP